MKKIVIVDDNHFQLKLMRSYLKDLNAEVKAFSCSQKAWEYLQAEKVDLLITDIMMPILDGIELCQRVATLESRPLIIAVSAGERGAGVFKKIALGHEVCEQGANEVLFKPFYEEDLVMKVNNLLQFEAV